MTPTSDSSESPSQSRRPRLKLDFFGGPALWRDGKPVRVSPFQTGLLSIAFGSGHARVPRSRVQRLLWGDDGGKAVRHRLSQLVYQTNHRCQDRVITLEGEHVRVDTSLVATDLQEFHELLRSSNFGAACSLIERGFLSAFPRKTTDALADWIEKTGIGKRTLLRNKALAAWDAAAAADDWTNARVSAEALLRLDPHDEAILQRVMRAQDMGGMVREAESLYRSIVDHAEASGHWSLAAKTSGLLTMARLAHRLPHTKPEVAGRTTLEVPLVGRESELVHLTRSVFQDSATARWHTVAVSGEAGLGKTRLVGEAIRDARLRGQRVMHACPGNLERDIPLSPLLEALNQPWVEPVLPSIADPWRSNLRFLLPQFAKWPDSRCKRPDIPLGHAEALRRHTCEALLRLFTAIAEEQPTVVFLDDFHSIDESSASVLQFLHRRWRRGRLTLLLCYRQEELAGNELVARLIGEMKADPGPTSIRLCELSESAAKRLVTSVDPQLVGPRVDEIVGLAGGNPFFLIELAADALPGGDGPRSRGDVRVPHAVRAVVAQRVAGLEPHARSLLAGLAVFGRPATLRQLSRILGRSRYECIDALEPLQELGLVARGSDKSSIRHGIVRHAVYQDLSPARRSMLHALAAEVLRSGSAGCRPDLAALHYFRAGDRDLAHTHAIEATRATAKRPPADRLRLLSVAYETSEGADRHRVTLPLARAHHRARRLQAAMRYGEEALGRRADLSRSELVGMRLIVADSGHLLGRQPLAPTLVQLGELEGLTRAEGDDAALAAVLGTTLLALHRAGDRDEVLRLLATMERMHPSRNPLATCRILAARAMMAEYGDPATGLTCARQAVTIARESQLDGETMCALQRHIAALANVGQLATEQGRAAVLMARSVARRSDDISAHVLILLALADWHTVTGNPEIAAKMLREARTIAAPMDCPEIRALRHLARGNLALARGDLAATESALLRAHGRDAARRGTLDGADGQPDSRNGPVAGEAPVPANLFDSLASLEGSLCLESGKFGQAAEVARNHPVAEPLAVVALELVLLHARLMSIKGDTPAALALLARAAEAHEADRPVHWLRLILDLVRLARRSGRARPRLAVRARDLARELNLSGLAHEFVPFAN